MTVKENTHSDNTPVPLTKNSSIAIIGAGVSGLTAAYSLVAKGYRNVVVFEKEERIGGKVYSYIFEGNSYELGAVWLSPDYRSFLDVYQKSHGRSIEYEKATVTSVLSMTGEAKDYRKYVQTEVNPLALARELTRFVLLVRKYKKLDEPGFVHADPNIQLSFEEFVKKNKVDSIARLAASFLTGCGYGYYRDVPAMYLMKFLPIVLKGITRFITGVGTPMFYFPGGWQRFYEALAGDLDVRLGHEVVSVERKPTERGLKIYVRTTGQEQTFDRVVLTGNLKETETFLDWSKEERDLFGKIQSQKYLVSLIRSAGLPHATVSDHATPETVGHIAAIGHFRAQSDVYTIYQLLDDRMDLSEATDLLRGDLKTIGGRVEEVIVQKMWNYFPFIQTENLAGYYERLEALQGKLGAYYLGGLLNFETVERNTEYAQFLVAKHFV